MRCGPWPSFETPRCARLLRTRSQSQDDVTKFATYDAASAFSISGLTTRSRFSGVSGPTTL
jgi:hypothetical protein